MKVWDRDPNEEIGVVPISTAVHPMAMHTRQRPYVPPIGEVDDYGEESYEEISGLRKKVKKGLKKIRKIPKKAAKSVKKGVKTVTRFAKNHGGEVLQAAGPLLGGPMGMLAGQFGGLLPGTGRRGRGGGDEGQIVTQEEPKEFDWKPWAIGIGAVVGGVLLLRRSK